MCIHMYVCTYICMNVCMCMPLSMCNARACEKQWQLNPSCFMAVNVLTVIVWVAKQFACHQSDWHRQAFYSYPPPSVLNNHVPGNLTHIHSQILSLITSTFETDTKFFSQTSVCTHNTTSCHKPEHCNLKQWLRLKKCFLSYEIFHNVKLNVYILGYYLVKIYHAQQHQLVSPNCTLLHSVDEVCSSAQCENPCEKNIQSEQEFR